jgi:hypothetical protein
VEASERLALTALCAELPELRAECQRQPEHRKHLLARIEAEARARRPIGALLGELLGTDSEETVRSLSSGLPGTGAGQADEETFGCPDGACDHQRATTPAGPIPRCPVTGQAMRHR